MAQTARVHASNSEESGRRLQLPNKEPVSNTEHTNHRFKIPSAGRDFFSDPFIRENGSSSVVGSKNQGILNELQDYIQSTEHRTVNNNKGNSLPNKMATSSSSATNQQTANANGFQMSMNSSTGPVNKSGAASLGIPASVHLNNQLSTILDPGNTDPGSSTANTAVPSRNLTPTNPNPASMKLLASNQPALSPQNQYDQYNPRQEMLLHGSFREVPIAPRAPNAAEQYGSQQRFASARSENQLKRGLNPQTSSPFPPGYYNQDSISSQAGQRSSNSQPDERNMITNQHFQWQSRLQTSNHCSTNLPTNTSPGPPMSRAQLQQPGIPQQQLPYMMLGNSHQQQQQSHQASSQQPYAAYIMQQQGGMKAGSMSQAQPYYGNMSMSGRQVMGQTSLPTQGQQMGGQIQKPSPDYTSFQQQQQMQHRYPQPQFPQQMPYLAQQQQRQQQQTYPQPPTAMPRMPSSHPQPILPKPASAEMFGASTGLRYASNNGGDSLAGQDFVSNRMSDQQQLAMPSAPVSYGNPPMGRMSSSSEMIAKYGGSSQGGYQRGNPPPFPGSLHSRHSPSPNITLGSPLRSVPEGTPPSVGMANFGTDSPATSGSMSNYPPGKLPTPFGMGSTQMSGSGVSSGHLPSSSVGSLHFSTAGSSVGGPAAAAAAAAVLEAANSGARYPNSGPAPGQPYMSSQEIMLGRVPSPTLNELPTAEDVEAMIESMRAGETSLSTNNGEEQPSRGSAPPPPSVATVSGTVESSPSQGPPSLAPQGTTVNATDQNSNSDTKQLNNSTLSMPGVSKDDNPQSAPSSPLSTFSGLSPGVSPSGVSITSSFGDAEIDLDEINPSLPNNPISMSSYQFPSSKQNQQQYDKFSKLYELSDEPERKEFLDKYQEFMNSQGTQISQVPVVARQPLDLFKFFTVVRDRGGLQEVVRRKLWQDVLEALNLPMDNPSIVNNLRNQYSRYLLSFEMKHTKQNSIDDIKINLLENSGIPPPNATVTCSEAIIPTNSLTQSQRETSSIHGSYNSMTNESPVGLPPSYNARDSYAESSYENSSKSFPDLRDSSLNFQMKQPTPPNSFGVPPYPYSGDRRQSLSNQPQGGLPPYMLSQRNMYPGPPSMSPYFQQSTPQSGHPAANYPHSQYPQRASPSLMGALSSSHSMMPTANPQDKMHVALWGSQYSPSTEPEHIVDYPPGAHSGRTPRSSSGLPPQFSPAPPYGSYPGRQQSQYSAATPPYRPSPSPSPSSRQPLAQSLQASQKMKYPHQQATQQQQQQQQSQQAVKRDMPFPNDCVEATRPVFTKKRKLTSRDLGPVEAWRVMMSLKSGLLSEATWALDTLNILLYDDNTVAYFMLSQLPGLLENLIDHFRRYLTEIFGAFDESEITVGAKVFEPSGEEANEYQPSTEEEDEIDKINQNAKRSFSAVLVGSTFQFSREGFHSGSSNWLMGGGDTTLHIQTHMGSMLTEQQCQSTCMKSDTELQCSEDLNFGKVLRIYSEQKQLSSIGEKKSEALCMDMNCPRDRKCMVNCKELKKESSCPVSVKEDSESKPDTVVKTEEEQNENSTDENDDEKFTANLKKELDLDLDSDPEDSEADVYIQREVVGKMNVKQEPIIEEQSCGKEDAPLCLRTETQDAVSRRCLCVSNILRGLSFVPLNDAEMSRHAGLLLIVGRLLLLHHRHAKRVPYRHSYLQEDIELESPSDDRQDWWWYCLEGLRENALVIIANIAGQLDLSLYPEAISLPLLDGLLHWFVCPSATAEDPMPTATPGTSLSPRQLVLEALAKMSILEANVDLILSSPPLTRVDELYGMLVRLVGERGNPVTREFALVLLSNLAQGENSFVGFGDSKACISMLLEFIEDAASTLNAYSAGSALAQAGFPSENLCGTSVDMLRRAASTLVCLARIRSNRKLFLPFQQRILRLAIMKVLDNMITGHLAEILFYLSR